MSSGTQLAGIQHAYLPLKRHNGHEAGDGSLWIPGGIRVQRLVALVLNLLGGDDKDLQSQKTSRPDRTPCLTQSLMSRPKHMILPGTVFIALGHPNGRNWMHSADGTYYMSWG